MNINTQNVPARPCRDASVMKEAGRETVPESHVSHFPWSCLSCCWLTDVVCSFQARISRVQLDLLQGESDNHIFFHSQQFDMDFVKWVCRNVRFCYLALSASCLPLHYESVDKGCCQLTLPFFCLSLSGKPASRLSHQPHRHRTGYWIPHGRGLSV